MSAQVWLVRHGQASWDQPDYDQLSPLGREQCAALGRALRERGSAPQRVVTGGLRRHRQSWDAIAAAAGLDRGHDVDPRWNEYDHDDVIRVSRPDLADHARLLAFAREHEDPAAEFQRRHDAAALAWTRGGPGYVETFEGFTGRVWQALHDTLDGTGDVLVVTSGGPIASVVSQLTTGDQNLWVPALEITLNSSVSRVGTGPRLVSFNEHTHLPAAATTSV